MRHSRIVTVIGLAAALLLGAAAPAIAQDDAKHRIASAPQTTDNSVARLANAASSLLNPAAAGGVAGEIFGMPVSMGNYGFAKRVAYMFPRPWGASDLPEAQRSDIIWESLILHYESFRRGITSNDEQLEKMINELLKSQELTFTRASDPAAYRKWVTETLKEDVELFENQIRYLIQIQTLRDKALEEQRPSPPTEAEMQQEFLNEKHHVGGEMVTFETKDQAQAFYDQVKEPGRWETMKSEGKHTVRPVGLMTLEAYMDLWSIPKDQIYAFHGLEIGTVGPPMPFGKQWCVYRLLDKRTGDLKDFPKERESYVKQLESKKKYEARQHWIEQLKASAKLKVLLPE